MNRYCMYEKENSFHQGWYTPATIYPCSNFGARPAGAVIDLIVIHSISLPPGQYGGSAVLDFFANRLDTSLHPYFKAIEGMQVSAHFFIRRDGSVYQLVSCDDRAWHAGVSHYRGRDNCNDDSIGIELEGLSGDTFEAAQYTALATLCRALMVRYPIRYIAGHEHIAPERKSDPGSGFNWAWLQSQCDAILPDESSP